MTKLRKKNFEAGPNRTIASNTMNYAVSELSPQLTKVNYATFFPLTQKGIDAEKTANVVEKKQLGL